MSWTYSDPSNNSKDAVRFLVGDTEADDQLISDEEINFLIDEYQDVYWAASYSADAIAAKFAREVTHSGDGLSFTGDQLTQHYVGLAERLRSQAKRRRRSGAGPYVGGISWREREVADLDDDKIPTSFRSHIHDHPGTRDIQRGVHRDPLKGTQ